MKKKLSILIFTDLDGTLLHRDTFTFDAIKNYIKDIISDRIYVIPNTSKTDKEILSFNQKLGEALPYITENGSAIKGLNLINRDLPKESYVNNFVGSKIRKTGGNIDDYGYTYKTIYNNAETI